MTHLRTHFKAYTYYLMIAILAQVLLPERASVVWVWPLLVLIYHSERVQGRKFL